VISGGEQTMPRAVATAYFLVKDTGGHKLGYFYFDDPRSADTAIPASISTLMLSR
jgi:hypothetical protein